MKKFTFYLLLGFMFLGLDLYGQVPPVMDPVSSQTVCKDQNTTPVNFTSNDTGTVFFWTNDNPSIGLPANGVGNIGSFTGINNTGVPQTATITVTPKVTGNAFISNNGSNTVSVLNTNSNTIISNITVGSGPHGVAVSPDGSKAYVTNVNSSSVSVINTATNTHITDIPVGSNPHGIAISNDGTKLFTSNFGSASVSVIDATSNTLIANIPVGSSPHGIVASPDGTKIYVTNLNSASVSIINISSNGVIGTITGFVAPWDCITSPDGDKLYVSNFSGASVSVIDLSDNSLISTVPVGGAPAGITINSDGTLLYVGNGEYNVNVINTATNTVVSTIPVGSVPFGAALNLDGSKLYVSNTGSNSVSVINTSTNLVETTITGFTSPYAYGKFILPVVGASQTFTITVNPMPVVDPVEDQILCAGDSTESIEFTSNTSSQVKALVLGATSQISWTIDVQNKLIATGKFSQVDYFDGYQGTPDLALMMEYDAILVFSDNSFFNPIAIGDNLAAYVDAGGGVVSAVFANTSVPIGGAFNTSNYLVMIPDGQSSNTPMGFGSILLPNHPTMNDVNTFNGGSSSYHSISTQLTPGSYTVAEWSNGAFLITAKDNVGPNNARRVDLGFYPPSEDVRNDFWDTGTDGALIMANALLYVSTPPVSYTWTNSEPSIGLPSNGIGNIPSFVTSNNTVQPIIATITVTPSVTNNNVTCTGDPETFTITVYPGADNTFTSNGTPYTGGDTITACNQDVLALSITSPTVSNYSFTRLSNGNVIQSGTTPASFNFTATNAREGYYEISILNSFGCSVKDTVYLLVNPLPNPTAEATPNPVCQGANLQLSVNGNNNFTFAWSGPNGYSSNVKNPLISGITPSGSGDYTVTVTNLNGCSNTSTVTVLVNPMPTAFATPAAQTICSANSITTIALSGTVTGTTYSWTRNNTATVTGIAASGTGNITGILTNTTNAPITVTFTITPSANGCTGTAITATVLVNPTPTAVATPNAQTICSGTPITTILVTGVVNNATYSWSRDNIATVIGMGASGTGNISGTLTNTTNAPITVTFTITPSANGCLGTPITATVLVNPSPVGTISITPNPGCVGSSVQLSATGGTNYSWSGPQGWTSTVQNPTIQLTNHLQAGNYYVTITNASGCSVVLSSELRVNYPPVAQATYEQSTACTGSDLRLHASGAGSYAWTGPNGFTSNIKDPIISNVSSIHSGMYILTVKSPNGCTATSSISITINTPPALTATPQLTQTCEGSTVQLFASGIGSFQWAGPATWVSNQQNPVIQNIPIHMSGKYGVKLTATTGCISTATVEIQVYDQIKASAHAADTICEGQSLQLSAEGGSAYLWTGPNGFNSMEQNPRIDNIRLNHGGKYYVYVTNEGGCFGYAEVEVTILPASKAGATATPSLVQEHNAVQFNATPGIAYQWSGPLGFTSTIQNPNIKKVTRYMAGVYTVTITNENGCPSVARVTLRVNYTNKGNNTFTEGEEALSIRTEQTGTVYPNPTSGFLYFETESTEAIEYIIYDMSGTIQSQLRTISDNYITTDNLKSGIYHIRWKSKDQNEWTDSKFVKIR